MKDQFKIKLEELFKKNLEEITPIQRTIREKAWERYLELGLPSKKMAGYQYFPLSQFYQESFDRSEFSEVTKDQITPHIYPDSKRSYLIFVNGQFAKELSDTSGLPEEVKIMSLHDALTTYGQFLQARLSGALKEETDPLATLNIALIQMGAFVYIPPKIRVETPIQCLHIINNDHPVLFNPRTHFFVGKESSVQWIWDYHCLKDFEYFSNSVVDITLDEGAIFQQGGVINPCQSGWVQESLRVIQKRDSQFKSTTCTSGTKAVRQDFRIALTGENASCDLKGIAMLSQAKQAHVNVHIEHRAPNCVSNQLFKNVLCDTSRSSFEGKIYVCPEAQKTMAYQLNNNLLLSEKVVANTKPNLEIFADDVKASHGATISQLNKELMFYMKARGISSQTAKKLLVSGFYLDILNNVSCPFLRDRMNKIAENNVQC